MGFNCTDTLERLAAEAEYRRSLVEEIAEHGEDLSPLVELGFHGLDALVKSNKSLTYEQAFSLATFVCLASNKALYEILSPSVRGHEYGLLEKDTLLLHSVSLLQGVSTREAIIGLTAEEIAGMVAAALELDTVYRVHSPEGREVFAIGGMGGDRGLRLDGNNSKLFSVSTLSALALGEHGLVHKHHSYPNTSKLAGQSAIESLGARSDFESPQEMEGVLRNSGIIMTSCHTVRTLHTISHRLKGETINHVIGPCAIPHNSETPLNALIGVNHNVHPSTIIDALIILQRRGIQKYANSVGFCGLDEKPLDIPRQILNPQVFYANDRLKALVALDEVAPPPFATLAAFLVGERGVTILLSPGDFMPTEEAKRLDVSSVLVPNTEMDIQQANISVIKVEDREKATYVAMTVALGLFTRDFSHYPDAFLGGRINRDYLHYCFSKALNAFQEGSLLSILEKYVGATRKIYE